MSSVQHREAGVVVGDARRRFKPEARRKLGVIAGSILFGGGVALALKFAGCPTQVASTLGSIVTALMAAADELREGRAEPHAQRVERLIGGDVYRHPVLIAFYALLGMFVLGNLVSLSGVVTSVLAFHYATGGTTDFDEYQPFIQQAVGEVDVVLTFAYALPLAIFAAHRIERRRFLWVVVALVVLPLAASIAYAALEGTDVAGSPRQFWVLLAAGLAVAFAAAGVGTAWARRTQDTFVMKKLFGQLSHSDQRDLIDLVNTLPDARRRRHGG